MRGFYFLFLFRFQVKRFKDLYKNQLITNRNILEKFQKYLQLKFMLIMALIINILGALVLYLLSLAVNISSTQCSNDLKAIIAQGVPALWYILLGIILSILFRKVKENLYLKLELVGISLSWFVSIIINLSISISGDYISPVGFTFRWLILPIGSICAFSFSNLMPLLVYWRESRYNSNVGSISSLFDSKSDERLPTFSESDNFMFPSSLDSELQNVLATKELCNKFSQFLMEGETVSYFLV